MQRSRIVATASAAVAVLALAVGCSQDAAKPTAVIGHDASVPVVANRVDGDTVRGENARAAFHRLNRMDHVGRAHNAALERYARRMHAGLVKGDVCEDMLRFSMGMRADTGAARIAPSIALGIVRRTLAARGCVAFGESRQGGTQARPVAFQQSAADVLASLSPEAGALYTRIDIAVAGTSTSAELASALLPVIDEARRLTVPGESDVILASASVAQSSREHWELALTQAYEDQRVYDINAQYGGCLARYADAETAVSSCMGLKAGPPGGVDPISWRAHGTRPFFQVVMFADPCDHCFNGKELVHKDFGGAVAGALTGLFSGGPAAALGGALLGGVVGSTAELTWQAALTVHCRIKGGMAIIQPIQTT